MHILYISKKVWFVENAHLKNLSFQLCYFFIRHKEDDPKFLKYDDQKIKFGFFPLNSCNDDKQKNKFLSARNRKCKKKY